MKNVLIVTAPLNVGGFDIIATGLQMGLDKEKFRCTYYINGSEEGVLEPKVIADGAKVIHKPKHVRGYIKEYLYLKRIMSEGSYDIVHSHLMFYSGLVMRAAYKAGVKKRVPHSHMTNPCMENRSAVKRAAAKLYSIVMKRWLNKYGTDLIACGPESGEYLYGRRGFKSKGIILNNAVELSRYAYDENVRKDMREKLGIDKKFVVGHVGRLNYVKNHKFLLEVFYEIQKLISDSALLIVGDGEERRAIEDKAEKLGIQDKLILAGTRNDVNNILMAMDVFVFPSLYEGIPVTLVEAQAAKLACLVSDSVSKYVRKNENMEYLSLRSDPQAWAQKAIELGRGDRENVSVDKLKEDYDLKNITKQLEDIYSR